MFPSEISQRSDYLSELERSVKLYIIICSSVAIYLIALRSFFANENEIVWFAVRLGYFPFVVISYYAFKHLKLSRILVSELTCWSGATYIILYCTALAVNSGDYLNSIYIIGIGKICFALALMPVSPFTFYGVFLLAAILNLSWSVFDLSGLEYLNLTVIMQYLTFGAGFLILYLVTHKSTKAKFVALNKLELELRDRQNIIEKQVKQLSEAKTAIAIAETTQKIAHDVKKPFSILEAGLTLLKKTQTKEELDKKIATVDFQVKKSLHKVSALMEEIMDSNAKSKLFLEKHSLSDLITNALMELSFVHSSRKIQILVELKHTKKVHVDEQKIQRVLANILVNAVQAIPNSIAGRIIISSKEVGDFVEIVILNSDSSIPDHMISNVFEPYCTQGKKNGNGLGLAIAKKLVIDHGGKITCSSNSEKCETEFRFTLKKAEESENLKVACWELNLSDIHQINMDKFLGTSENLPSSGQ